MIENFIEVEHGVDGYVVTSMLIQNYLEMHANDVIPEIFEKTVTKVTVQTILKKLKLNQNVDDGGLTEYLLNRVAELEVEEYILEYRMLLNIISDSTDLKLIRATVCKAQQLHEKLALKNQQLQVELEALNVDHKVLKLHLKQKQNQFSLKSAQYKVD
ncbi:hypothetical protein KMW28_26995 [Flammeovirga yaeyamensis]|uniref:Uncharacterized protein n=1 Tax=Flammeovirga yaeyamensis TaxID=367791 RepID=A0AAX1NBH7_9BACT|nr:hypothetical protein [Flammeovirga yaeyamensis]MBB3700076.1 hypothetical protein [Flammeovirga yaeyamensis]NMF37490.1 hypothetical protein [Flammeovirga yaeyamensis]QWG04547.1 hypothetical protein KMW28_26995 [Flammeovirga yaeyamensis]